MTCTGLVHIRNYVELIKLLQHQHNSVKQFKVLFSLNFFAAQSHTKIMWWEASKKCTNILIDMQ